MKSRSFHAVIERIENGLAVLEPDTSDVLFEMPANLLPENCYEGAVLNFRIETNPEEEETKRKHIRDIQDRLRKNSEPF